LPHGGQCKHSDRRPDRSERGIIGTAVLAWAKPAHRDIAVILAKDMRLGVVSTISTFGARVGHLNVSFVNGAATRRRAVGPATLITAIFTT